MTKSLFYMTATFGVALIAASPAIGSRLRLPPARTPAGSIYSAPAIAGELAKRGYRIESMKRKGTAYSVTATGRHGNRVQMLVDGRSGDIVGLTVLQAAANLIGTVAQALKSGKSARYVDDTRPFGVVVPDRYQANWVSITSNMWLQKGAKRYAPSPRSGRGYRYAVPYYSIRPAARGGTRTTYSPARMRTPIYEVYESNGARLETVEAREDSQTYTEVTTQETQFSSQEETLESTYEESYFGEDVSEETSEQISDYDAEDGDLAFADAANDGYDADVDDGDGFDEYATADDEADADDGDEADDGAGGDDGDDGDDDDGGDDDPGRAARF